MLPLCLLAADQKLLHPGNYGMKLCGVWDDVSEYIRQNAVISGFRNEIGKS